MVFYTSLASAYPIIVSEQGVNHQKAKELVYSIPKEYYRYVDVIEFVDEPLVIGANNEVEVFGMYKVLWNKYHNCYGARIIIWDYLLEKTLIHELGHIYENCVLKKNISTEEFANNFKIQK